MIYMTRKAAEMAFGIGISLCADRVKVPIMKPLTMMVEQPLYWDELLVELVDEKQLAVSMWQHLIQNHIGPNMIKPRTTADDLATRIWLYRMGNLPELRIPLR